MNIDQFQHEICFVEFNQSSCDMVEWRSACRRDTQSQGESHPTNFGIYYLCLFYLFMISCLFIVSPHSFKGEQWVSHHVSDKVRSLTLWACTEIQM